MKVLIERTYLVRHVHRYEVEIEDRAAAEHAIDCHFTAFDEDVVEARLVADTEELVDEPPTLTVVGDEHTASVIPLRRPR